MKYSLTRDEKVVYDYLKISNERFAETSLLEIRNSTNIPDTYIRKALKYLDDVAAINLSTAISELKNNSKFIVQVYGVESDQRSVEDNSVKILSTLNGKKITLEEGRAIMKDYDIPWADIRNYISG